MKNKLFIISIVLCFTHIAKSQFIISESGDSLAVIEGRLELSENRKTKTSATITLSYQIAKFPSSKNNLAVVMLAGGPGGSWLGTAGLNERFNEIKLYQKYADVIIYDQRGAGKSIPNLDCQDIIKGVKVKKLNFQKVSEAKRKLAIKCRDYWLSMGVDLSAYNTKESTDDLEDLRQHLGYDQLILVGGSYGSHLALHYIRKYPNHVKCAILHGIEGPNHTLDMPSEVLKVYQRIASATEKSDYYSKKLNGQSLLGLHEAYLKSLNGKKREASMRLIADFILSYKAGDRNNLELWPDNLLGLYAGEYEFSKEVRNHLSEIRPPHAMNNTMDFASWATKQRVRDIKRDRANIIIGPINEFYFQKDSIWPVKDLGDSYRAALSSNVRVLLIHGTWDISTPIENAKSIHQQLSNSHLIQVNHGSHDAYYELLEEWDLMEQTLINFINDSVEDLPAEFTLKLEFPEVFDEQQIAFWNAVIEGDVKMASFTLKKGVDINLIDTRSKKTGRSALNWAAWFGHIEMIEFLLDNNAEINIMNKSGYTPIHHAIENCQLQAFSLLLKNGASLSIASKSGITPKESAQKYCPDIFKVIQDEKAVSNKSN